jgi:excisionase family DNA binding protein
MTGWMTVAQVARKLKRHPELIYRWLGEDRLKGKKIGATWIVSERELERFKKHQPERRKRSTG